MEKNGGPGKAREAGVLAAKGAYVTFMDSDDWYEKCFWRIFIKSCQQMIMI